MRFFSVYTVIGGLAMANIVLGGDEDEWKSPEYKSFFEFPLPIPPEITPLETYTNPTTGASIDFYQLRITAFEKQIFPGLGKANLVGYNGISPGPTFRIERGRQSVVRFVNEYDRSSVVHLHGSYTRPTWDGWAEDVIKPGQYKDYYYPNSNAARTMWYHDHAAGITAQNAYGGQAGFYIVEDSEVENRLGLPQGNYDIPLALAAKYYTKRGDISDISKERDNVYGDVIEVNGQPWPYLDVEPRKYRFRILNTAVSRTFELRLTKESSSKSRRDDDEDENDGGSGIPFIVVASDAGFMNSSVTTLKLTVAMAERWEIIVDFSNFAGQSLTMKNAREVFTDEDYAGTDRVMQFNVGKRVTSTSNNGPVPSTLVSLQLLEPDSDKVDRTFKFERHHGKYLINGVGFADVKNRIIANPPRGKTEIWSLEHHSGKWSHPIHIHMVDFQILSRKKGRESVEPYEREALKDVAVLGPDERIKVAVKFAPMEGLYMFHCHNLIHEDHDMMAAFNISSLRDLGYNETDLSFIDPMDPEWRAQSYEEADDDDDSIVTELLPRFQSTNAYQNITGMEKALDQYWESHDDESGSALSAYRYSGMLLVAVLIAA